MITYSVVAATILAGASMLGNEQGSPEKARAVIADPRSVPSALDAAVAQLRLLEPAESPAFWVKIANDPAYRGAHRALAAVELFRRHVRAGSDLASLARIDGISAWFTLDSVFDMTRAAAVPVSRGSGSIVMLQPSFFPAGPRPAAIYLRLSRWVSIDRFLDLVHGRIPDDGLLIADVGISE